MKSFLIIFALAIVPTVSSASCNSYMINEHGDGDIIETFRSRSLFFSCRKVLKECQKALDHAPADAVCVSGMEFDWKMVQEIAHDIDKTAKLLHRDLENMTGDQGHNDFGRVRNLTEMVHELAEAADELHESVERSKTNSHDTRDEFNAVKKEIKNIRNELSAVSMPNNLNDLFDEIKQLFNKLRKFY